MKSRRVRHWTAAGPLVPETKGETAASGFTLVELGVAALVVLLVSSLLWSGYVAAVGWFDRWRQVAVLENNVHLVLQRLTEDLVYADQFAGAGEGRWYLRRQAGDTVRYRFEAGALWRNGVRMHDRTLRIRELRLVASHADALFARPPESGGAPAIHVQVYCTVEGPGGIFSGETGVVMRPARPWRPTVRGRAGPPAGDEVRGGGY